MFLLLEGNSFGLGSEMSRKKLELKGGVGKRAKLADSLRENKKNKTDK